ncbi:hypothetical protein [Rhodococcus erythropolis]|uniref:hypothetical protein n=1 Tax=Rhodococcus erythropolis TaxID=1833 RepID=UPI001BE51341|nr:hypothetical protein [Rhodococcus erythropolis]MBT2269006.1 hypothetical protein [Rhodococcus erythropolis]
MSAATGKPVPSMLATLGQPPTGERYAFESKWDGQRAITTTGSASPALWSRNGNNISASCGSEALSCLSLGSAVMPGRTCTDTDDLFFVRALKWPQRSKPIRQNFVSPD